MCAAHRSAIEIGECLRGSTAISCGTAATIAATDAAESTKEAAAAVATAACTGAIELGTDASTTAAAIGAAYRTTASHYHQTDYQGEYARSPHLVFLQSWVNFFRSGCSSGSV